MKLHISKFLNCWLRPILHRLGVALISLVFSLHAVATTNTIDSVEYSQLTDQVLVKLNFRDPISTSPTTFTVSAPPRVVLDFVDVVNGTGTSVYAINLGPLKGINIVQSESRARVVLNLSLANKIDSRIEGNSLFVSLPRSENNPIEKFASKEQPEPATNNKDQKFQSAASSTQSAGITINSFDFRAESVDVGTVQLEVSDPNAILDARQQGPNLQLTFPNSSVLDKLVKRYDVRDFGTPIESIAVSKVGSNVVITVANKGDWDYNVRQIDTQILLEVRRNVQDPNSLLGSRNTQGKVVSFNFTQPVPVGQMIGIFQDITGLNFMVMPGVTGEIQSLKMENTPVDEAITVISRMYNLGFRKYGNIVVVGKADDLLKYDKDEKERAASLANVEPIQQETFRIKFRSATEIAAALQKTSSTNTGASGQSSGAGSSSGTKERGLVSDRGMLTADDATNTIYVEDTKSQLAKIRERIQALDRPSKQVMIEARFVEVTTGFQESLGVKLTSGAVRYSMNGKNDTLSWNANSGSSASYNSGTSLSFSLYDNKQTKIVALELDAGQKDSTANTLAGPKILTRDNQKATLKFGQKVPSATQATAGQTPTISYVDAVTSLDVKPQVQIDGRLALQLTVKNDSIGDTINGNVAINNREITTNVVVENGGSVMIGGMYITNDSTSTDRVPFFGDLPYIGFLFKMKNVTNSRKEMLVFLTARVVSEELTLQ